MNTDTTSNAPNLDAMDAAELSAFWVRHHGGIRVKELFPEGGEGTKTATRDLAHYAINKAVAMKCRARGDITAALTYETICDRIYKTLPAFAHW
jgi:hypothetical protein